MMMGNVIRILLFTCLLNAEAFRFTNTPNKRAVLHKPLSAIKQVSKLSRDDELLDDDEPTNLLTLTMFMIEATRSNPDHAGTFSNQIKSNEALYLIFVICRS